MGSEDLLPIRIFSITLSETLKTGDWLKLQWTAIRSLKTLYKGEEYSFMFRIPN